MHNGTIHEHAVSQLLQGGHFCSTALVCEPDEPQLFNYLALTHADLYTISRDDFLDLVLEFDELFGLRLLFMREMAPSLIFAPTARAAHKGRKGSR